MRHPQRFTGNKATVRNLQRATIQDYLGNRLGSLRYFGLPSTALLDAIEWENLFSEFVAVERGEEGKQWEMQYDLMLMAFRVGLFDRISLLRGDIDEILHKKQDSFGKKLRFPFDVISLDYSGGLFYRNKRGVFTRLRAIEETISHQSKWKTDFVFLISCNLDAIDQGEVKKTLENIRTELVRYGITGDTVIDAYIKSPMEEARLKIYVPFFINLQGAKYHYNCQTQPVIFYAGNQNASMLAFRFFMAYDERTASLRPPRERLSQLFNTPMLQIIEGEPRATMLELPKLSVPESTQSQ